MILIGRTYFCYKGVNFFFFNHENKFSLYIVLVSEISGVINKNRIMGTYSGLMMFEFLKCEIAYLKFVDSLGLLLGKNSVWWV